MELFYLKKTMIIWIAFREHRRIRIAYREYRRINEKNGKKKPTGIKLKSDIKTILLFNQLF